MSSVAACVVITTVDSEEQADRLAQLVMHSGLGACVQIQKIRSTFRWEEQIHTDDEYRLEIKTLPAAFETLQALLKRSHPYDTPEIILLPIAAASPEYVAWLVATIDAPGIAK